MTNLQTLPSQNLLTHPVFEFFERWSGKTNGFYLRDFLGTKTDPKVKKSWKAQPKGFAKPNYPVVNEHYYDWLVVLSSVLAAKTQFNMIELGAGYAPWLVRAAYALKQIKPELPFFLVGVEGDSSHFQWMVEHFENNDLLPEQHMLIEALISNSDGTAMFPKILDPSTNYGASLSSTQNSSQELIEVKTICLKTILSKISGDVDLIHMDVQGEEEKIITSDIDLLSQRVKQMLIATHKSNALHENIRHIMRNNGWIPRYNFDRNSEWITEWGNIHFYDGFQYWINPRIT